MKYKRNELEGKALTVLGPIPAVDLGITLCHEHCIHDLSQLTYPPKEPRLKKIYHEPVSFKNVSYIKYGRTNLDNRIFLDEEQAVEELLMFRYAGGKTVVDCTIDDLGRDPIALRRISLDTGLNVIMGSGYYSDEGRLKELHRSLEKRTEDDIAAEIIKDIFEGVRDTGIHAGLIGEIGSAWPLAESEKKRLRAAGIAQKETGAPLHIHPGRNKSAPTEIIKILKEVDTDLTHTAIDHVERTFFDGESRYTIIDSGCYLSYDSFGYEGYYPDRLTIVDIPNDAQRIAQIKDLIAHGYGKKILVSYDIFEKHRHMAFGGHGYAHILDNAVPAMRNRNITEEQINDLLIENPKEFLKFK